MKSKFFGIGLILVVLLGIYLRIFLFQASEKILRWDSIWYYSAAQSFARGEVETDCCDHGAGYPLSLVPILSIVNNNTDYVRIYQTVQDIITGLILSYSGYSLFGLFPAISIFLVYLCNPFTSPYSSYFLTETLTFFIIALLLRIYTIKTFPTKPVLWITQGVILGYLYFTKPGFIYFTIIITLLLTIVLIKKTQIKIKFFILTTIGLAIISLLPLQGNRLTYGKFSLTPPYTNTWGTLYIAWYENISPEIYSDFWPHHPIWEKVIQEYWDTPLKDINAYNAKYKSLYLEKLYNEWPTYIRIVARNMIFFWDKRHFLLTPNDMHPGDELAMRLINLLTWIVSVIGFMSYLTQKNKNKPLIIFTVGLFIYMNFLFSLVSNMTRHSLPFYPVLLFWAGYGTYTILIKVKLFFTNYKH